MEIEEKTMIQEHPEGKGHGFKMKKKAILVLVSSENFGKSYNLDRVVNLLGRGRECVVRVKDSECSKVHCSINRDEEGYFTIEDEKSTNGTLVNGKKLKKSRALNFGDRIVVGHSIFRFLKEEAL
ncbi:MAG: FHA domain-containing protein [Spirochaetaceae bacterium]|jgi:pSer/pThr/pTyr-binding forkhead associated (FHA) protein|nr:FHA domain-containing protein [Spirochaetaceae bacterium]